MAKSRKLEVIYYDGQPDGICSINLCLSPIKAYVVPRSQLFEAKKLKDIYCPGIYYLVGEKDGDQPVQLCIGQTRKGIDQIDADHSCAKKFWTKVILFLADHKAFSAALTSGLETYAIRKAVNAGCYKVECAENPRIDIDEDELPPIETAYEEIQFIMAIQGYPMEKPQIADDDNILHTTRRSIEGKGIYDDTTKKFVVLAGSQVDMSYTCLYKNLELQRQTALNQGKITYKDGKHWMTESMTFDSPSGAAVFVLGGSQNGWVEWKNKDGTKLEDLYPRK